MSRIITIAVDGESGAGKGTLSAGCARVLGLVHWNSGQDYRAIGIAAEELGMKPEALISEGLDWEAFRTHEDVLTDRGGKAASAVAQFQCVRDVVNEAGRQLMGTPPGCVVDGRSGAWEFPEIPVKIYLTCSLEERARRRCLLIEKQGGKPVYDEVLENLRLRDHADRTRAAFPLKRHPEARHLDNTTWSAEQTLSEAVRYCLAHLGA